MKSLLVTSEVTFVPRNYDDLVCSLAACPQVGGLLVLRNRSRALTGKACALILAGAWRLGFALLINQGPVSARRRRAAYAAQRKPTWHLDTINSPEALALVAAHGFDLILNARTRCIYKEPVLRAPPLGCINIHHGLLPEQRGTMCDLWALSERQSAGFSMHAMTRAIDAGGILARVQVSDGSDRHYPRYLRQAARIELATFPRVLREIESVGRPEPQPNRAPPNTPMRRNPDFRHLRNMIRNGMQL